MRRRSLVWVMPGIILTLITSQVVFADLSTGLIARYTFDGNANDQSGHHNDGVIYGATPTTDRFGNPNSAYSFDGAGDHITIPNSSSQQVTTNQLTVSAWIELDADVGDTQARILCKQADNNLAWGLEIFGAGYGGATGNQINFHDSNGSTSYSCLTSTHLDPLQLYHVAVTDNSGLITIFIDGQENYSSGSGFGIPSSIAAPIQIGATNPPDRYCFNGILDDIRIYDRALSAPEIHELYAVPLPGAAMLGVLGLGYAGIRLRRHR